MQAKVYTMTDTPPRIRLYHHHAILYSLDARWRVCYMRMKNGNIRSEFYQIQRCVNVNSKRRNWLVVASGSNRYWIIDWFFAFLNGGIK
jgi:hypothetical protein